MTMTNKFLNPGLFSTRVASLSLMSLRQQRGSTKQLVKKIKVNTPLPVHLDTFLKKCSYVPLLTAGA